jgi:hypothetical protein
MVGGDQYLYESQCMDPLHYSGFLSVYTSGIHYQHIWPCRIQGQKHVKSYRYDIL